MRHEWFLSLPGFRRVSSLWLGNRESEPLNFKFQLTEGRPARNPLLFSFVRFLANTCLRRSEALRLKWTDIDRSAGFIHVRESKNGKPRTIPMENAAWDSIKDFNRKVEYVFKGQKGFCQHKDSFLRPLKRAAKRAAIDKRIGIHTLRHSYGSNKIRAGWGLKKVSMILGHSDISMTSNIYTHLLDGDLKVQDDFRFDNRAASENSERVTALFTEFVSTLAQQSGISSKNLENCLDTAMKRTSSAKIKGDVASSADINRDSTTSSKGAEFVTLVSHSPMERCADESADPSDQQDNLNNNGKLPLKKWRARLGSNQ
ncbi:site-specific integrase [Bdellovibrionota bacterium FG-2]